MTKQLAAACFACLSLRSGITAGQDAVLEAEAAARLQLAHEKSKAEQLELSTKREDATIELLDLRITQQRAVLLFGEDHISLLPLIAAHFPNDSYRIDDRTQWRVAGAVSLPLLGVKWNGWFFDWYPELETDAQSTAYMRFEKRAHSLSKAMVAGLEVAGVRGEPEDLASSTRRYRIISETFRGILERHAHRDEAGAREARQLLACLDVLDDSDERVALKLDQVDALWDEYEFLYGAEDYPRRANILLGPALATPLHRDFGRTLLFGAVLEIGGTYLGASLSGGMSTQLGNWKDIGVWLGVGLTGELGDNIVNGVNGANQLASSLTDDP